MNRTEKEAFVSDFNAVLADAQLGVVVHYRGLTVSEMETLRKNMREAGASIRVAKNRLVKLAAKGTFLEGAEDMLLGPSAIATSADPVAAARVAHKFAKDHENLIIIGGALGEKRLEKSDVEALAKLPSLDELRSSLLGTLLAPASQLVRTMNEPAGSLARVLQAKVDAEGGAAEAA